MQADSFPAQPIWSSYLDYEARTLGITDREVRNHQCHFGNWEKRPCEGPFILRKVKDTVDVQTKSSYILPA